ncbi:lasso peptide biosynthesis B2 protein [Sphingomonas sp.]|uniref:lasso peptide biosynthesis B2 protein n=1 Tax=Sphingomonas sp. TaxID=28214 RepID=UPI0034340E26
MNCKSVEPEGLKRRPWRLVIEAALFLTVAATAIAVLRFPRLARLASGRAGLMTFCADERFIGEIRRALDAATRRLPFRTKCFERGLAAQWMLRRRGIDSTLFYGAALETDGALSAHVWVRAGDIAVVGCENASDYALLACFPAENASAGHQVSRPRSMR